MRVVVAGAAAFLLLSSPGAEALTWTNWTEATIGSAGDGRGAAGTLGTADVNFSGDAQSPTQVDGGSAYWATNAQLYTPTGAENPPPPTDIISLQGGPATGPQVLEFSAPVTNPLMAILSLGNSSNLVGYDFDQPFDILRSGSGFFGGDPSSSLSEAAGDILQGAEGHGLIRFNGTFDSISWTIPNPEFWHGFTLGLDDDTPPPEVIPLPAAGWLLMTGMGALGFAARRRRA